MKNCVKKIKGGTLICFFPGVDKIKGGKPACESISIKLCWLIDSQCISRAKL